MTPGPVGASRKEYGMSYHIVPLILQRDTGEKSMMTYQMGAGKFVARPFVVWVIQGAPRNIILDTAIEFEDYVNYHPSFVYTKAEAVMSFKGALERVGLTADKIDIVIQTHLHFDHCYNTRKCINARIIVQRDELHFAMNPGPFRGMYKSELLEGLNFEVLKGDRRLFEGIELLHVPGHSPGCQAVAVQTDKGRAIISGFCSINENFFPRKAHPLIGAPVLLPGLFVDGVQAYESILRIKSEADIILPLHDEALFHCECIPQNEHDLDLPL